MTDQTISELLEATGVSELTLEQTDEALLARGQEILDLLKRASTLGFTISLSPQDAREVVRILESAVLQKDKTP